MSALGKIDSITSGAVPAASWEGNVSATDCPLGPSIWTSIPVSSSNGAREAMKASSSCPPKAPRMLTDPGPGTSPST